MNRKYNILSKINPLENISFVPVLYFLRLRKTDSDESVYELIKKQQIVFH